MTLMAKRGKIEKNAREVPMQDQKPSVAILTLGCKVNQYESEAIAEAFSADGFAVLHGEACCDAYVVNTCTVTAESERKARQLIRRLHAKNEGAFILVTGCFSQSAPDAFMAIEGVDYVCGNRDKLSVVAATRALLKEGKKPVLPSVFVGDIQTAPFEPMRITHFDRTRAYVKIEDGCENRCSYCAIPAARGRVRSKPLADVVEEVRTLVENGCREVVLTGIETASWGRDLDGVTLADLLEAVDGIKGIGRVRLGSLDPSLFREDFVARIAGLSSLAPHFHISMQSGSSRVLAAMKRKYNAQMAKENICRLRRAIPEAELTTDFIVGFPGESEADFAETMDFAASAEFLQMHIFPYSRRAGTVAATMKDQVAGNIKRRRAAELAALGKELCQKRLSAAIGTRTEVLFETFEEGLAIGHTASFFEVEAPSPVPLHSVLCSVRILSLNGDRLVAEILDREEAAR